MHISSQDDTPGLTLITDSTILSTKKRESR